MKGQRTSSFRGHHLLIRSSKYSYARHWKSQTGAQYLAQVNFDMSTTRAGNRYTEPSTGGRPFYLLGLYGNLN